MPSREATHAGSWYSASKSELSKQLDDLLDQVPSSTQCIGTESSKGAEVQLPFEGARAIIAPHAAYAYSGPAAAWAYKALDVSRAKRVFVLGPSHHHYLSGCALSKCDTYETPLGNLRVDTEMVEELYKMKMFERMSQSVDEAEHSLEMHLPYIYKILSRSFADESSFPPLVPIMVGSTDPATERRFGTALAPYLADPGNLFILSSDFCHWGSRFRYTYYVPSTVPGRPPQPARSLRSHEPAPTTPPIHGSIAKVDTMCMDAVEGGMHAMFSGTLAATGNTVCGRHPIGVLMAAVEKLGKAGEDATGWRKGRFRFVRYERSNDCVSPTDSSVSYCSAFAVLEP